MISCCASGPCRCLFFIYRRISRSWLSRGALCLLCAGMRRNSTGFLLLILCVPLIVAFNMCFGSLYTQMQIASFILRFGVLLNSESRPCPAGCFWLLGSSSKFLIYFSSTVIGNTSSSSYLSGWASLRLTTMRPWSLWSLISQGVRNILGKKSCFSSIF